MNIQVEVKVFDFNPKTKDTYIGMFELEVLYTAHKVCVKQLLTSVVAAETSSTGSSYDQVVCTERRHASVLNALSCQ